MKQKSSSERALSPQEFSHLLESLLASSQAEMAAAQARLQSMRQDDMPG